MATNTKRKNTKKTSSKTSTRRSSAKTASSSKSAARTADAKRAELRIYVVSALVFVFAVLNFMGNIGAAGTVGDFISRVLFGLFGIINYVFPIFLISLTILFFIKRNEKDIQSRIVLFVVLYFMVSTLIELITNGSKTVGPVMAFKNGYLISQPSGGGFFGGCLADLLVSLFDIVPAFIIVLIAMALISIFAFGFSPIEYLKQAKADREALREELENDEAYKAAQRDNLEYRKQKMLEREQRRAEKNQLKIKSEPPKRMSRANSNIKPGRKFVSEEPTLDIDPNLPRRERTVTGMSFNTEIAPVSIPKPDFKSDDMNEIRPEDLDDFFKSESIEDEKIVASMATEPNIQVNTTSLQSDSFTDTRMSSEPYKKPSWEDLWGTEPEEKAADDILKVSTFEVETKGPEVATPEYDLYSDRKNKASISKSPVEAKEKTTDSAPVAPVTPVEEPPAKKEYVFPPTSILTQNKNGGANNSELTLKKTADKLEMILSNFGVNVKVTDYSRGPSVTRFELLPEMGTKVSKIVNLTDDIKMNLAATDIRIEAPIPGKNAIGIEVPNTEKTMVGFRELVESSEFKNTKSNISFALGLDLAGKVIISDIAKMPHVLIAGATGSGKSVCINTIIMSILYKANPDDVKFIMIDPKVVELSVYNGIPHLLIPVVTDPKKAAGALQWAVNEMMDRYKKFADCHVRDMAGYNEKIKDGKMEMIVNGEKQYVNVKKMPQIVVVVDELADLMMVASKEVEESICRLAQLARAAGIHLIIATQRPSVNVITGLIKANMPSRIAFAVTSGVDSRTILDMVGAERLLGKGDMLYYPQGIPKPLRVQGAFVTDKDVSKVTAFIREHNSPDASETEENMKILEAVENTTAESSYVSLDSNEGGFNNDRDEYFNEAAKLLIEKDKGSIGMLQRNFKIGFNRAARIIDQLEEFGVVGPEVGTKPRKILVTLDEFESMIQAEGGR